MTLWMRDIENIEKGKEEGREKGREEGREQANTNTAINLFADGMPVEKIARMIGETVDTVTLMLKTAGKLAK